MTTLTHVLWHNPITDLFALLNRRDAQKIKRKRFKSLLDRGQVRPILTWKDRSPAMKKLLECKWLSRNCSIPVMRLKRPAGSMVWMIPVAKSSVLDV